MTSPAAMLTAVPAVGEFGVPDIEWSLILPVVFVLGAAAIGVLVEAFAPRTARLAAQLILVFGSLLAALVAVLWAWGENATGGGPVEPVLAMIGSYAVDGPSLFLQGTILLLAIVAALFFVERRVDPAGDAFAARASAVPGSQDERDFTAAGWLQTEIWPLFLFAVGGMMLFVSASDLLTLFIALEIMSLPLYLLTGMARRRRLLSQEAAMKYFILGAFASAFFLYGSALLYGFAGTVSLPGISEALSAQPNQTGLALGGAAMLAIGLLFKVAAVPFHSWAPDVYQGAPTVVTGFMAAGVKVAAFGALLRVVAVGLPGLDWDWRPALLVIAALSFLVGSIVALSQSDIKRMLAYSSIAHAGFLLLGVTAANDEGVAATLFYLAAYGFATLGAFAIISLVRDDTGEANRLSQWAGLGKRSPLVAGAFALFLLAFAGIPLTSGFIGKFAVFGASIAGGAEVAVVLAVLASAVAAFFYVRVIVVMFFSDAGDQAGDVAVPSALTSVGIAVGVVVTVLLGVLPQGLLDLAGRSVSFAG